MKRLMGLVVGVAMMSAGGALADGDKHKEKRGSATQQQTGEGIGGSGQTGQMEERAALGEQSLSGEVIRTDRNAIFVKSDLGPVVALKVKKDTQWDDPATQSAKDLEEGQQVRASFEVQGTENIAKNISLEEGMGGSGLEEIVPLPEEQPLEEGLDPTLNQPVDPATGGSGTLDDPAMEDEGGSGLDY